MKLKKIGKRTVKTGLAVGLTLVLSKIFKINSPFFAAIAAVIAMQSSVSQSLESSRNRMYSTVLGAVIALIFSYAALDSSIFAALGVIIIIYICTLLHIEETISLATMVFLSIILNYEEGSRLSYASYRTIDTFLGLLIGTLVNYFLFPHKLEEKVNRSFKDIYHQLKQMLEYLVWNKNYPIEELRDNLTVTEDEYKILKQEIKYKILKSNFQFDYSDVFEFVEDSYIHLKIMSYLGSNRKIDHYNKEALEKMFQREIPLKEVEGQDPEEELDIIYN